MIKTNVFFGVIDVQEPARATKAGSEELAVKWNALHCAMGTGIVWSGSATATKGTLVPRATCWNVLVGAVGTEVVCHATTPIQGATRPCRTGLTACAKKDGAVTTVIAGSI